MEIKGGILGCQEKIRLQRFQRRSARLHLKKVLGPAKSHVKRKEQGRLCQQLLPLDSLRPPCDEAPWKKLAKNLIKRRCRNLQAAFAGKARRSLLCCQAVMIKLLFPPVLLAFGLLT